MRKNQFLCTDALSIQTPKTGKLLILDGSKAKTKDEFLSAMEEAFQFPEACGGSLDAFMDWIRDLSWFPYDEIQLAIEKQAEFLSGDAPLRNTILSCFQNEILPYWEERAELEMKGGKGKRFDLYLVNTIRKE